MKAKKIATIATGQDGAIYGKYLFRLNHKGDGRVYLLDALRAADPDAETEPFALFTLDGRDWMNPHSNAVFFGAGRVDAGDEFPILYTNIYNNYAENKGDRRLGTLCAYRLTREGNAFSTALVQIIEVGFAEDTRYWRSPMGCRDIRPYGNFVADNEKGVLYAYTMRDLPRSARYFSFPMPAWDEGAPEPGHETVRRRILTLDETLDFFDVEYHRFIQGGCCHGGKIYEVEGFTGNGVKPDAPAVRVIDPAHRRAEFFILLETLGLCCEPEFIDFAGDECWYSDGKGSLFRLDFEY